MSERQTAQAAPDNLVQPRSHWQMRWLVYAAAIGVGAVSMLTYQALLSLAGEGMPTYVFFFPFIMAVALLGGGGPGIVTTLTAAVLVDYYVLPPIGRLGHFRAADAMGLGMFVVIGVSMSVIAEIYQRDRLKAAAFDRAEAIREAEQRAKFMSEILEQSTQAYLVGYPDGRVTLFNRALSELTGYTAEELRVLDARELTPPEWSEVRGRQMAELWDKRQPVRFEQEYRCKDGRRVPVELLVHAVPGVDEDDCFCSFITDITERKRRAEQVQRLHRTLQALTQSSRAMLHATSEAGYLKEVCEIIVQACGHPMVWVGYAEPDEQRRVRPVAFAGFPEPILPELGVTWADSERGRGPVGTAIRTGKTCSCGDIANDPNLAPWRAEAGRYGFASALAVPLVADGRTFGAFCIYASEVNSFSEDETRLLEELGGDMSISIASLRLRAERQLAERLSLAINSVNSAIHSSLDLPQVLQSAVTEAASAVGCDTAAISFRRPHGWVVGNVFGMKPDVVGAVIDPAHEPHSELAIRTGAPVAIDDAFHDARVDSEHMRQWGVRSVLVIPLLAKDQDRGALFLNFAAAPVRFHQLHLDFGRKLASSLSLALENAKLFSDARREIVERERAERRTRLLANIAVELLSSESPQRRVASVCRQVLDFLDCQLFFNFLLVEPSPTLAGEAERGDDERKATADAVPPKGRLQLNAYAGISAEEARRTEWLELGVAVCGTVAREGACIVAETVQTSEDPHIALVKSFGVQAYACYPLLSEGRVLGTLSFGTRTRDRFSPDDLALMKAVANYVALAIERQQVQAVLHERAEDLRRSNRDLEQFAYVASHDLQEPLRAVGGYLRLLERRYGQGLDSRARSFLDEAVAGALRMERIIRDLLVYSRVGSRGGTFRSTDLGEVLKQAMDNLLSGRPEETATITHDPLPVLRVDPTQMLQLLQNLLSNALKFRADDAPMIHISAERRDGVWQFGVRDNGIGIDAHYYGRIFQLFQRLHTRAEFAGTGIGLAVCQRIVERHGGRIWVESKVGEGSTFYFTIPDAK